MAVIGNNNDSFLHALSDFWIRFFADRDSLAATYEGSSVVLGQAYLDLLTTVLNTAVTDAPLFRKEYYKLLAIREDQLSWDSINSRWKYTAPDAFLLDVAAIQNKVYAADAALAKDTDFGVSDGAVWFTNDISKTPPALFPFRQVSTGIGGTFSASGVDWVAQGVKKGDVLWTHPYFDIVQGDRTVPDEQRYVVVGVTSTQLQLSTDTPAPLFPASPYVQTPAAWWVDRVNATGGYYTSMPYSATSAKGTFGPADNVLFNEVSLWAVDAKVDDFTLYQNFGHLFTDKETSTEAYRALIRGLMQLYMLGPAIDRIESALNVIAHIPVVRNDGETLVSYDDGIESVWNGTLGSFSGGMFNAGVPIFSTSDVGGYVTITSAVAPSNVGTFRVLSVLNSTTVQLTAPAGTISQVSGVVWEYSKTDQQTVVTSGGSYSFDRRLPVRADIAAGGPLTFRAFEVLSNAIQVVDYVKDPTWWHGIVIPQEILPTWDATRRTASTELLLNYIGPAYGWTVGDPGFYVGADENLNHSPTNLNYRHSPGYIMMERFLKTHMFQVKLDPAVQLAPSFVSKFVQTVREAKPAYTYVFM